MVEMLEENVDIYLVILGECIIQRDLYTIVSKAVLRIAYYLLS